VFLILDFLVHTVSLVGLINVKFEDLDVWKMVMKLTVEPQIFCLVEKDEFVEIGKSRVREN
jgi:hypothetical protein